MKRSEKGQALLEFALLTPLLFALLFGAIEFGYAFYTYNNLAKAVRSGVRYASMRTYPSDVFSPVESAYLAAVKNVVVYGEAAGGTSPVVHGLTPGQVTVTIKGSGAPQQVTVAISNYSMSLPLGNVVLSNKPATTMRFIGRFAPN